MVVEFNSMWLCGFGGWPLCMYPLHLQLKLQYTVKLVSLCTTDPTLDQMVQYLSPKSRNGELRSLKCNVHNI